MPIIKGSSKNIIAKNIKEESKSKPHNQAIAIAYSVARESKKKSKK